MLAGQLRDGIGRPWHEGSGLRGRQHFGSSVHAARRCRHHPPDAGVLGGFQQCERPVSIGEIRAERILDRLQHRPVGGEVVKHRGDPEQVHIGRLQRAGLLLVEEATAGLVDPGHRDIQRKLLHPTGCEEPLHAAPAASIPHHRRGLVAQTHQLGIQPRHQLGHSHHRNDLPSRTPGTTPSRVIRIRPGLCAALNPLLPSSPAETVQHCT